MQTEEKKQIYCTLMQALHTAVGSWDSTVTVATHCGDCAVDWMPQGSNSLGDEIFHASATQPPVQHIPGVSQVVMQRGMVLTTHRLLVPRLQTD